MESQENHDADEWTGVNKGLTKRVNDIAWLWSSKPTNTCLGCPQCGYEFIHPTAVRVVRKNDATEVTSNGITVREAFNQTRGVQIIIEYACEDGHRGNIKFQFHKGMTYILHQALPEKSPGDWKTLWRD